jgi:hypothetical protein
MGYSPESITGNTATVYDAVNDILQAAGTDRLYVNTHLPDEVGKVFDIDGIDYGLDIVIRNKGQIQGTTAEQDDTVSVVLQEAYKQVGQGDKRKITTRIFQAQSSGVVVEYLRFGEFFPNKEYFRLLPEGERQDLIERIQSGFNDKYQS